MTSPWGWLATLFWPGNFPTWSIHVSTSRLSIRKLRNNSFPAIMPATVFASAFHERKILFFCLSVPLMGKKGGSVSCADGASHPGQVPSGSGGRNTWVKLLPASHHNHRRHCRSRLERTNFASASYLFTRARACLFSKLASVLSRGRPRLFLPDGTTAEEPAGWAPARILRRESVQANTVCVSIHNPPHPLISLIAPSFSQHVPYFPYAFHPHSSCSRCWGKKKVEDRLWRRNYVNNLDCASFFVLCGVFRGILFWLKDQNVSTS